MCKMLELYTPDYEIINTKERITIDLLRDGQDFLEQFEIKSELILDTVSLVYKYLRNNRKIFQQTEKNLIILKKSYLILSF